MSILQEAVYTAETINNVRFRIPLYQRPYAWGVFQVEQLLKDLYRQFDSNRNQKYYIGILNVGNTENNGVYDLIDGQQRITTLILIGRVLVNEYEQWADFLNDRLDLYGRKEDQQFIIDKTEFQNTNKSLVEAMRAIELFFNKEVNSKSEFSKYIFQNAAFFISKVPDHYSLIEKNLQFVRMNNRGRQLEAHDVLKIKLASEITDQAERNKFITDWNVFSQLGCGRKSDDIIEPKSLLALLNSKDLKDVPEKEYEIFYQSIVTYSEFLLIALARFFKSKELNLIVSHKKSKSTEYRNDRLLEEFGFGEKPVDFKWTEATVLEFGKLLSAQFNLFDKYIIKRDKEENYKFTGDKERFTGDSLIELQVFQSFLYVTREPNQNNWLIDTFNYLGNLEIKDDKIHTTLFLTYLKKIDDVRFKSRELNSFEYGSIDRYWFWRLDYYLWENRKDFFKDKSLEIADRYVFRVNRSIEHVAPQNPQKESQVKIDSSLLNSFGNLAMISSGQNSSLQNETFEIKRAHVESFINGSKNGTIESLKMLHIYEAVLWNNAKLKSHSNNMIEVLINSFENEKYPTIINNLRRQKIE